VGPAYRWRQDSDNGKGDFVEKDGLPQGYWAPVRTVAPNQRYVMTVTGGASAGRPQGTSVRNQGPRPIALEEIA